MEEPNSKALDAWLHREATQAQEFLEQLPERPWFVQAVRNLDADHIDILRVVPSVVGDFLLLREPHRSSKSLRLRDRSGKISVLADASPGASLDDIFPSTDGQYVAYVETRGGTEEGTLKIVDVRGRKLLEETADRVRSPIVTWWPGKAAFCFTRYLSVDDLRRAQHAQSMIHTVGTSFGTDVASLGKQGEGILAEDDEPTVTISRSGRWAVAIVRHGVAPEVSILVQDARNLRSSGGHWRAVVKADDQVTAAAMYQDEIYLLSQKGTTNGRILRLALSDDASLSPRVAIPESSAILQDIAVGKGGLYLSAMTDGVNNLLLLPLGQRGASSVTSIGLPADSSVRALQAGASEDAPIAVRLEGWFRPPEWSKFDGKNGAPVKIGAEPNFTYRGTVRRVTVRSQDGTEIPVTILAPTQSTTTPLPTQLFAYGSYGISVDPQFRIDQVVWVQRGGIYAIAHVRGGGEKGENWHVAGMKENKHRGIEDYLATADYLISSGVATPDTLIATTGSAGGVVVGPAIVERPELFAGAIFKAALLNPLRLEQLPAGSSNVSEFGTVSTPEGSRALLAMDSYEHIHAGTKYPDILLVVGANDPRVAPWQSTKFAERIREATGGKTKVFTRVTFDEGHGMAKTGEQANARFVDASAFAWWRATKSRPGPEPMP